MLDSDRDYHLLLAVISTRNSGRKMAGAFLMAAKLVSGKKERSGEKFQLHKNRILVIFTLYKSRFGKS